MLIGSKIQNTKFLEKPQKHWKVNWKRKYYASKLAGPRNQICKIFSYDKNWPLKCEDDKTRISAADTFSFCWSNIRPVIYADTQCGRHKSCPFHRADGNIAGRAAPTCRPARPANINIIDNSFLLTFNNERAIDVESWSKKISRVTALIENR